MDDYLLFKEFLSFLKRSIPSGISVTNRHLFILGGHGSHITFGTIEQAKEFGLDMITLPSHTSHAFQRLDVVCLKLFKNDFRKERDVIVVKRNYTKLDKLTLARWVDKALDLTLTRNNIMSRFKSTRIWPLNARAINSITDLSILYTLQARGEEESK
jgi:hypothetical protein